MASRLNLCTRGIALTADGFCVKKTRLIRGCVRAAGGAARQIVEVRPAQRPGPLSKRIKSNWQGCLSEKHHIFCRAFTDAEKRI